MNLMNYATKVIRKKGIKECSFCNLQYYDPTVEECYMTQVGNLCLIFPTISSWFDLMIYSMNMVLKSWI